MLAKVGKVKLTISLSLVHMFSVLVCMCDCHVLVACSVCSAKQETFECACVYVCSSRKEKP